ncbi:MAG: HNH endonuclease [Bacilli bacterium]|nr:HNH endonuclease [Bacilli bacterium]
MKTGTKSYKEMIKLKTFEERFDYLKLDGRVGKITYGADRIFNQSFYHSKEWRDFRAKVIARDNGCDLGCEDREIFDKVIVHHINPMTMEQLEEGGDDLFDLDNFVCCSHKTHEAIHYGDESLLPRTNFVERKPGDTKLW